MLDEETGDPAFTVSESENIAMILAQIQSTPEAKSFAESMNKFIHHSNVTKIGYLAQACPECNEMPDNLINGYSSFDVQSAFFTIAVRALVERS